MSKLETFLKENKIDPRRIVIASNNVERRTREDYALKMTKQQAKAADANDEIKEKAKAKPRSGKPVTRPLLARALRGEAVSGSTKSRILRAVNRVLEQKKQSAVDFRALW